MMKFKYLIATSVAALLTVSAVNAADLGSNLSFSNSSFDWNKNYIGLHGGYTLLRYKALASDDLDTADSPVDRELKGENQAFVLGAFGGVNRLLSHNMVVGADVDAQYYFLPAVPASLSQTDIGLPNVADVKRQANLALRAKLGYAVGRALPYVAAGIGANYLKRAVAATPVDKPGVNYPLNLDSFTFGWTVGAGVDLALTDKTMLRLEYRYNDMGPDAVSEQQGIQPGVVYTAMRNPSATSREFRMAIGVRY